MESINKINKDSPLFSLLLEEGKELEIVGNKPLFILDPEKVWIVLEGKLDLFLVQAFGGKEEGPRRYLECLYSGEAIFGMEFAGEIENQLIAKGMLGGAKVLEINQSRLKELATDPTYTEGIAELMDGWIRTLSKMLPQTLPPVQSQLLEHDKATSLKTLETAVPKSGIVWVKHEKGESFFIGNEDFPIQQEFYIPISRYTWLLSQKPSELFSINTRQFLIDDSTWAGLQKFLDFVQGLLLINLRKTNRAEYAQLKERTEYNETIFGDTLTAISSVLLPKGASIADSEGDSLIKSCQIIGNSIGIKIVTPAKIEGEVPRNPLDKIAAASRFRTRKVALAGEWWKRASEPMLVWMKIGEEERPMALLPISSRKYEMVDPVENTRQRVDEALALKLEPFGFSFYVPFPDREINVKDIVRLVFQATKKDLGMVALMGLAAGLLGAITPMITGAIFDKTIPSANQFQLLQFALALGVGAFGALMFEIAKNMALLRVQGVANNKLQAAIWDRLLGLPVTFFKQFSAGDLAARANSINQIREILSGTVMITLLGGVFSLFNVALLFYYHFKLALVAIGLVLLAVISSALFGWVILKRQKEIIEMEGKLEGMVLEFVSGITKFRMSGTEKRAFSKWGRQYIKREKINFQIGRITAFQSIVDSIFPVLASMTLFGLIVFFNKANLASGGSSISTGMFLAFNAAFIQFLTAALAMAQTLISVLNVFPLYKRAEPILKSLPESDSSKSDPGTIRGEVEVNRLFFQYNPDDPMILKDVSFKLNPGEFVAVVGTSGSGKSTLLRLLLGFETPTAGGVYYDGKDLASVDIRSIRKQIGVVLQNGQLMDGDIFTNIIGSSLLTLDDAWEAANMSGLADDIKDMPMGMHTVISGSGGLSGGQKQRMLIARAIVRKPRILFFDEATSALDNRTQAIVSESLDKLDATRVVIAHRLSTIINADRIIVLDKGTIAQMGTYAELIEQEGLFAEMATRQLV